MAYGDKLASLRDDILDSTITQDFGPTDLSFEPRYMGYPHFHQGVDYVLAGGRGSHVRSAASGVIRSAGWHGGYGNAVEVQAPSGATYLYGHMDSLINASTGRMRRAGEPVEAGDVLGQEGSTGASTGPHIHLQITDPHGFPVDPTGASDKYGHLRTAQWESTDERKLFGTLYHILGYGGGYLGNQQTDQPPDPYTLTFAPLPDPLPTAGGDYGDPGTYPPPGADPPPPGISPPGTGTPVDWNPGTLVSGGLLSGLVAQGPQLERQIGPALLVAFLALATILIGLLALVRKPAIELAETAVKAA